MNTPYVKKLNENGEVINPIKGSYLHQEQNRKQRRLKLERFVNNRKTFHLTVTKTLKYARKVQEILLKDGSVKRIGHYILRP